MDPDQTAHTYMRGIHGIITPQCVDKMLSNNTFLETRIQRLLHGLIFVEKGLGVHVQRMLKMNRVYTLAEILSKIFVKLEDLKVLRPSPDLLNNVKIGQGQLQLIMEQILFFTIYILVK